MTMEEVAILTTQLWDEIKLKPSSNVKVVHYDSIRAVVRVTFKGGARYDYYGVGEDVLKRWERADSTGKFLNEVLKVDSIFPCRKVGD